MPEAWAGLYAGDPRVDRVIPVGRGLRSRWNAVQALRDPEIQAIVNFHASPSSALLCRLSGAPLRAFHFHGFTDRNRFSNVEIPDKGVLKPITERDADALRALGPHFKELEFLPKPSGILPKLSKATLVAEAESGNLLGLGLGASRATKIWPMKHFAGLAEQWLAGHAGGRVVAFYGPGEEELAKVFSAAIHAEYRDQVRAVCARDVHELMRLVANCKVFVGNDSGPRHVAAALGVRTVTVFGPENPFEWHPYPQDRHPIVFHEGLKCRTNVAPNGATWCGIAECTVEQHRCLADVTVKEVLSLTPGDVRRG